MDSLILIVAVSTVIWYCIDRFKGLWANVSFGNYITTLVAAILGFAAVFAFNLDILYAVELYAEVTIAGQIITGLVLMSGSSAVSEIIERIKGTSVQG